MEDKLIQIELIDRFVSGLLSEDENTRVKHRLAEDEDFRKLFDDMEIMTEGIRNSGAESTLEEKLVKLEGQLILDNDYENEAIAVELSNQEGEKTDLEDTKKQNSTIIIFFNRYKMAIAASIALIIISWLSFRQLMPVSETALFTQNFEPYLYASTITRGEAVQSEDMSSRAYAAYARADYPQAASLLESIIPTSQFKTKDQFFLGNTYLAMGQGNKAIEMFSLVVLDHDSLEIFAQWYLGLSYLQTGDTASTIEVLIIVRDAGLEHAEEAKKIVNKLT